VRVALAFSLKISYNALEKRLSLGNLERASKREVFMEESQMTSSETLISSEELSETVQSQEGISPLHEMECETLESSGEEAEEGGWLELLETPEHAYCCMEYGDILEGIVMQVDREEILVDVGAKAEGIIPSREFRKAQQAGELDGLKPGDTVYVFVLRPEDEDKRAVLSIDRARLEKSWRWLEKLYEEGEVVEAAIDGYNKGGLLVNLQGVRGFIPASQVSAINPGSREERQDALAAMVGEALPLKVIEINRRRNRLILSERQAVREYRESRKEELLESLQVGQIYTGKVSSICNFGVFVDMGGADGLVHLSELSWGHVEHPRDVVKIGQDIQVYVLGIDQERKRIALSFRRTQPEPWSTVTERYHLGQLIEGEISQLATFGAFARIEEGIEGLIHISELSDDPIAHPREVVEEGDVVSLRIIRIDPVHRRIGLSLRRALREVGEEIAEETEEGFEDVDFDEGSEEYVEDIN
jgi:small subunit ribosomal protein S1